jgi:cytochrome c5
VSTEKALTDSATLLPQDPEIAAIYQRSCRSCHTVATTGAPLVGDTAAWAPRMDKGMDELLNSVVNGFGGMPPFGLCMDCSAEQFEALIQFMATGSDPMIRRRNLLALGRGLQPVVHDRRSTPRQTAGAYRGATGRAARGAHGARHGGGGIIASAKGVVRPVGAGRSSCHWCRPTTDCLSFQTQRPTTRKPCSDRAGSRLGDIASRCKRRARRW